MSDTCIARGCRAAVPPDRLVCRAHWQKLPEALRRDLFRAPPGARQAVRQRVVEALAKADGLAVPTLAEPPPPPPPTRPSRPVDPHVARAQAYLPTPLAIAWTGLSPRPLHRHTVAGWGVYWLSATDGPYGYGMRDEDAQALVAAGAATIDGDTLTAVPLPSIPPANAVRPNQGDADAR